MKTAMMEKNRIKREINELESALYQPKIYGQVRKVRPELTTEERIFMFERIKKLKKQLETYNS